MAQKMENFFIKRALEFNYATINGLVQPSCLNHCTLMSMGYTSCCKTYISRAAQAEVEQTCLGEAQFAGEQTLPGTAETAVEKTYSWPVPDCS